MGAVCVRLCGTNSASHAEKSPESPVPTRRGAPSPLGTNQVTLASVVGVPEARAGPSATNGAESSDEEFAVSATNQRKGDARNPDSFPHVVAIQHLRKFHESQQRGSHSGSENEGPSSKAVLLSFGKPRSPSLGGKGADTSADRSGARVAERTSLAHSDDSSEVGSRGSGRREGKKSSKRDKREKKARRAEKRAKKEQLREAAQNPHVVASQSISSASFTDPLDMSHRSSTFSESSTGADGLPPIATASPRRLLGA